MNIDTGSYLQMCYIRVNQKNIKLEETEKIKQVLNEINISFDDGKSYLNNEDVSKEIREEPVNNLVSQVSFTRSVYSYGQSSKKNG